MPIRIGAARSTSFNLTSANPADIDPGGVHPPDARRAQDPGDRTADPKLTVNPDVRGAAPGQAPGTAVTVTVRQRCGG